MQTLLLIIEIISAIILILAVLVHSAKGEGLGGIGGQARLFHSQKEMEKGLNMFTAITAGIFLASVTILSLMLH